MYANYSQIERKVANQEEFNSGNRKASHIPGAYVVFSYGTAIGIWFPNGERRINVSRYSQTTSRFQSILKRVWPNAQHVESEDELYTDR